MKIYLNIIVSILAIVALPCKATQIQGKSLDQRLPDADHIVVGVAKNLEVIGFDGKVISDPEADATGLKCRLTIEVSEVIKSEVSPFPKSITVTYQNKWHKRVRPEREAFVGRKVIYLLRGKDFAPVDQYQFVESIDDQNKIMELLKKPK